MQKLNVSSPYLSNIPAKFRDDGARILNLLPEGATDTQIKQLVSLIKKSLESNSGDKYATKNAFTTLKSLESIVTSPHFKLGMLGDLELITNNSKERAQKSIEAFQRLIESDNFDAFVLDAARLSSLRGGRSTPEIIGCLIHLIDNPNFNKEAHRFSFPDKFCRAIEDIMENSGQYSDKAIRAFMVIALNENFTPGFLRSNELVLLAKCITLFEANKHEEGDFVRSAYGLFTGLLSLRNFSPSMLPEIYYALEKASDKAEGIVMCLVNLLGNENFKPEMLNHETMNTIVDSIEYCHKLKDFEPLAVLCKNKNVSKALLGKDGLLQTMIKTLGSDFPGALDSFLYLLENPAYSPAVENYAKTLCMKARGHSKAALLVLNHLIPGVRMDRHNIDRILTIAKALEPVNTGVDSKISDLAAITHDKNFGPEAYGTLLFLAEKSRNFGLALACMRAALDNQSASFEELFSSNFFVTMNSTINSIIRESDPNAADAVYALAKVLSEKDFTLKDFDGISGLLAAAASEAGKWAPDVLEAMMPLLNKQPALSAAEAAKLSLWLRLTIESADTNGMVDALAKMKPFLSSVPLGMLKDLLRGRDIRGGQLGLEYVTSQADIYMMGKALADSIMPFPCHDAAVYANFGYAIRTIGREKAEALYRKLGIVYFMRYSKEMLEQVYANAFLGENSDKPVLLVTFNKNDWNGAFYLEGRNLDELRGRFIEGTDKFRIIISEVSSESQFYDRVRDTAQQYGKIDTLIIGGHGQPDKILLGSELETGNLDLTDREELAKISDAFAKNPTIALVSCSTGRDPTGIGALLSDVWRARLFAPAVPTNVARYRIVDGELKVEYREQTREYQLGRRTDIQPNS